MPLKAKVRALCARSAPPTMAVQAIEKGSRSKLQAMLAQHTGILDTFEEYRFLHELNSLPVTDSDRQCR